MYGPYEVGEMVTAAKGICWYVGQQAGVQRSAMDSGGARSVGN